MSTLWVLVRKLWLVGGWAPVVVFSTHVVASQVFNAYHLWPHTDVPMHFAGGFAIAFFISGCFCALPRDAVRSSRLVVLEAVLVGSMATTAAVVWEFAEFTLDRIFGSNIQVSLPNTMQDLGLGMLGAAVLIVLRGWQERAGAAEVREVAGEWLSGRAA